MASTNAGLEVWLNVWESRVLALANDPQVERIVAGHLHRPITRRFAGTVASTCPSTAHQIALDLPTQSVAEEALCRGQIGDRHVHGHVFDLVIGAASPRASRSQAASCGSRGAIQIPRS